MTGFFNNNKGVDFMKKAFKGLLLVSLLSLGTAWAEEAAQEDLVQAAAIQGDAKAQAKLGAMYLLGNGQEKDEQQAAEWLIKAATQGYVDA
ncbi:MAG: hypothetical protein CTY16_20490, partial [Methylobacter sp.]